MQIPRRYISGFQRQDSDIATSDGCALEGRGSELEVPEFCWDHRCVKTHTFIQKVIQHLKDMLPGLQVVHYISDSPSSQYRKKSMVAVVAIYQQVFGIAWSYIWLEIGHD